ncbi:GGDEF domain-containing protein [Comamonas sp. Y33R10-2]|uniref:GGDEF domain-containing protein n=1 Tax=Comamonas sp. Y33R10-2 TaxID=2853257 RepID=UPI001C5CB5F5|nr:GGDEF domain-containing protein [Comamonas sp. Y33R10-2]QXZ09238.1 GGDEF domain-containing protein [Comamonas sp. Y33R10-2]
MPDVDQFSVTLMAAVNLMTVAFALPWFMGKKMSRPARNAQQFLLLHGLAWLLILVNFYSTLLTWNALLAVCSTSAAISALWQLHKAIKGWVGPRHKVLTSIFTMLCLLTWAGVAALALYQPYRLAWFSISYSLTLFALVAMVFFPRNTSTQCSKAWRYLFVFSTLCIAATLIARGIFTLEAPWIYTFAQEPSPHLFLTWAIPFFSSLTFVSILMACRDEELSGEKPQEDMLTGLPLRQNLKNLARSMLHRAHREKLPLALIFIDMDNFSRVNKRHGYSTGDDALQLISRSLKKQMRGDELVARWQGESFCLIVHADLPGANALLTRIKSTMKMGAQYELQLDLDFSAGCAIAPIVWKDLHLGEMSQKAEIALEQAKKLGSGHTQFVTLNAPQEPATPPQP